MKTLFILHEEEQLEAARLIAKERGTAEVMPVCCAVHTFVPDWLVPDRTEGLVFLSEKKNFTSSENSILYTAIRRGIAVDILKNGFDSTEKQILNELEEISTQMSDQYEDDDAAYRANLAEDVVESMFKGAPNGFFVAALLRAIHGA